MCGLNAIYAYHPSAPSIDRAELLRVRDHMRARGPDGAGEWLSNDGRVGLGHRRLAIIDPDPRAAQPMLLKNAQAALVLNGEIYNYRELRAELLRDRVDLRTESDTEVLLYLLAREGERALPRLRGMFALAFFDQRRGALLLARDPYGIKPLYLADDGWTLRVASQVKALLAGGGLSSARDPAGLVGFHLFGSVPEPFTLYQDIRAVTPGAATWVDSAGPWQPRSYFSIPQCFAAVADHQQAQETCRAALRDSVRAHQVADVPVGAFLSAGVDSGALVGSMAESTPAGVQAVTIAFDEFVGHDEDEAPLAARVAAHYGVAHRIRRVSRAEFLDDLPAILAAMDQPSIDGINTWFAAKAAHQAGLKVVVSGVGGDELLGGYDSFRWLPKMVRSLAIPARLPLLGRAVRALADPWLQHFGSLSPKAAGLLEYGGHWHGAYLLKRGLFMPWELKRLLPEELVRAGLERLQWPQRLAGTMQPGARSAYARVAALESQCYLRNQLLRDADWASMAHSLELRTPLVDAQLLTQLAPMLPLAGLSGKALLASVPQKPLPDYILQRRKTGFATPVTRWLKEADLGLGRVTERSGPAICGNAHRALGLAILRQFLVEEA